MPESCRLLDQLGVGVRMGPSLCTCLTAAPGASEKGISSSSLGLNLLFQTPKLCRQRTGPAGQPPTLLTLFSCCPPSLPALEPGHLPGFLQHTKLIPAPGPLHLLSPPPGCFFLGIQVSAQLSPPQRPP